MGTLAVGIGSTALIYGFCSKVVVETKERYRDMKCLLELTFSFDIKQISVCEEFIACASDRDFQVVRVKGQSSYEGFLSYRDKDVHADIRKNLSEISLSDLGSETSSKSSFTKDKKRSIAPSPSQCSTSSKCSVNSKAASDTAQDYILDDENYVHWTFEDSEEDKAYDRQPHGPPRLLSRALGKSSNRTASATTSTGKTIILKGTTCFCYLFENCI